MSFGFTMSSRFASKALALGFGVGAIAIIGAGGGTACHTACSNPGEPTPGKADAHCGSKVQKVDPSVCHEMALGGGGSGTSSSSSSASTATGSTTTGSTSSASTGSGSTSSASSGSTSSSSGAGGAGPTSDYGPTLYGTSGDDDDCKYHVVWSSSALCENQGVTFTVKVTSKTDGSPVTGAGTLIEAVLGDTHSSPMTGNTTEDPPGTYQIGPVIFDEPGMWTVRFHIHEECSDLSDESPHGHAAFFVNVP